MRALLAACRELANDYNTSVGGIVQPATFVELRFCEFAPESRAFLG